MLQLRNLYLQALLNNLMITNLVGITVWVHRIRQQHCEYSREKFNYISCSKINPDIIIAWCPCHILHNASCKASKAFSSPSGFGITDHCVDLFYWFDRSSKRKCILKEYYDFCDMEHANVIKLISTCCLCLEMCVNRDLKKFKGLKCYFCQRTFQVIKNSNI